MHACRAQLMSTPQQIKLAFHLIRTPVFLKTRDHRLCEPWFTIDQIQQRSNLPTLRDTTSRESFMLPSTLLDANRQEYQKAMT